MTLDEFFANPMKCPEFKALAESEVKKAQTAFAQILKDEASKIVSTYDGRAFLDNVSLGGCSLSGNTFTARVNLADVNSPSMIGQGSVNLVKIFNFGYTASKQVYGMWHGQYVGSRQSRPGTHFIETAVAKFCAAYPGVKVRITY